MVETIKYVRLDNLIEHFDDEIQEQIWEKIDSIYPYNNADTIIISSDTFTKDMSEFVTLLKRYEKYEKFGIGVEITRM